MALETNYWKWVDIRFANQCWPWIGGLARGGWGRHVWKDGNKMRTTSASRAMWLVTYGASSIPDGWQVDHLCRNRVCVNPTHLEAVPAIENIRRAWYDENGDKRPRKTPDRSQVVYAPRTVCANGHDMTDPAGVRLKGGRRLCRRCLANHRKKYKARRANRQ